MAKQLDLSGVEPLRSKLAKHPIYGRVRDRAALRVFMEHHVYPVWDFMSLVKFLQGVIAPTSVPWVPRGDAAVRRFINEIVLEEESDEGVPGACHTYNYASHFELYCAAMSEVGADPTPARTFVELAESSGIEVALATGNVPEPAREFMRTTFDFIASGKPHVVAAAFSLGRESVIPSMFRALLERMGVTREQAPAFHYYLERHIHLDEGTHAPLALKLLENLCGGERERIAEARQAACAALSARIRFWDGVLAALPGSASAAA
ncbi:DUF3050 domain-containing protein [Thiobacter aerophilum]|uniref:DUF3050 domain-containing protein n=1 Tax=Thiobacter aerophilum TaxID=3121275 RepID=A0ABV0EFU3_9BURK